MGETLTTERIDLSTIEVDNRFNALAAQAELADLHEPLITADKFVNRHDIETQAHELIAQRLHIETSYKTNKTYLDDARTLLFEALTASGHLSTVKITGTIEEIHSSMLSVLLNAYSDSLPAHEKRRRFQEICEELTLQTIELKMVNGEVPLGTQTATISDYVSPGALSEKSAQSLGYRPYNKKGMVRSSALTKNQDGTYTRVTEQVSRSNSNAHTSKSFLESRNVTVREAEHADVAVLGTQFMHDMSEGVVGLIRRLDQHQGASVRYGEMRSSDQIPYEDLAETSSNRESVAYCYVEELARLTHQLDRRLEEGVITKRQHADTFKEQVGNILRAICVMDPNYAVDCFGKEAQAGFMRASNLTALGDYQEAANVLLQNQSLEQTVSFCGMSLSKEDAERLGVDISSLDSLLKLGKEGWNWSKGVCRVEGCPTKPGKTDVGPCSVCRGCQHEFDRGNDPTRSYRRLRKVGNALVKKTAGFQEWFQGFISKKPRKREKMTA